MKAQVTLTPSESKRLIALSLLKHPKIRQALKSGVIVINLGSTNAYLAEEILGRELSKERFVAGMIDGQGTCVVPKKDRIAPLVLKKGEMSDEDPEAVTKKMGPDDLFIKGANAVDPEGRAWVMLASETGGTIGHVIGTLLARGVPILVPVGMEKLVPEGIDRASLMAGIYQTDASTGVPVGIMQVPGELFTEIEAFKLLGDVEVFVIGAGGIGGGEGSRTFLIEGEDTAVKHIFNVVKKIKGEVKTGVIRGICSTCYYKCPERK